MKVVVVKKIDLTWLEWDECEGDWEKPRSTPVLELWTYYTLYFIM